MVLDVVLFLWNKVKAVVHGDEIQNPTFTYCIEKIDNFEKVCIWNTVAKTDSLLSLLTYALQSDNWSFCTYTNMTWLSIILLCCRQVFHSFWSVMWCYCSGSGVSLNCARLLLSVAWPMWTAWSQLRWPTHWPHYWNVLLRAGIRYQVSDFWFSEIPSFNSTLHLQQYLLYTHVLSLLALRVDNDPNTNAFCLTEVCECTDCVAVWDDTCVL